MASSVYPTHGKFALELERQGLTITQVVMCANILRCPMTKASRAILLGRVRRVPFKTPCSPYQIQTSRRGKNKAIENFAIGLQLMGMTPEDYLDGKVAANRLAFALWLAHATRDPIILADVSRGLQQGYRCPVSVNKLSDWINGHRDMTGTAPALLNEVMQVLGRPVEEVKQLELGLEVGYLAPTGSAIATASNVCPN